VRGERYLSLYGIEMGEGIEFLVFGVVEGIER